jgi:hypothetical protein
MNDLHNDHWKMALHIRYTFSDLDLYIMTLSELCLKGISLLYHLYGIWLTSVQKVLKQDVIIIRAIIVSQMKHGTQWDRVDCRHNGQWNRLAFLSSFGYICCQQCIFQTHVNFICTWTSKCFISVRKLHALPFTLCYKLNSIHVNLLISKGYGKIYFVIIIISSVFLIILQHF